MDIWSVRKWARAKKYFLVRFSLGDLFLQNLLISKSENREISNRWFHHFFKVRNVKRGLRVKIGQKIFAVTVMLVTSLCWWLYDGDRFEMLVAESLCWRLFSLCWWFFQFIKSVTNISNLLPTYLVSNIHHQHQCNRRRPLPVRDHSDSKKDCP